MRKNLEEQIQKLYLVNPIVRASLDLHALQPLALGMEDTLALMVIELVKTNDNYEKMIKNYLDTYEGYKLNMEIERKKE